MSGMQIKIYIVHQAVNLPQAGERDSRVLDVFLTHADAADLRDRVPGTWIEKKVARKGAATRCNGDAR